MFDSFERVAVYCNKAVPSNAEALNNALRVAKASIDIAAGEYIGEVGSDAQQLFNPEARAQWYRASDEMLAIVQRADPKRYCTWWPGNLLKLTPEIALREFRTGYREAKQRNASGAKER